MIKLYHRIVSALILLFSSEEKSFEYYTIHVLNKEDRTYYTEDGLGHNHAWDDMYHSNEAGEWVEKEGWVYCEICGHEKHIGEND
jgi:hypothetical protein